MMQAPDLTGLFPPPLTFTLPTGRVVQLAFVRLDTATQRFWYESLDVTPYLSPSQKRAFPGFDIMKENAAVSDAIRGTGETGSTSTLANWLDGLKADAVAIAQGTRDFVAGKDGQSSDLRKLLYVLAAGAGLFLVWKIVQAWKSK